MIYISCGLNQEFIIDLLEKTTEEGVSFKYEGKTGIKLAFHVNTRGSGQGMCNRQENHQGYTNRKRYVLSGNYKVKRANNIGKR
ncbi:MAG: hypothetical protein ACLTDX_22190 [[Clostridium] innocuum]